METGGGGGCGPAGDSDDTRHQNCIINVLDIINYWPNNGSWAVPLVIGQYIISV